MEVLREYVRMLVEEPQPGVIAPTEDLALAVDSSRHSTTFVLYNPRYYAQALKADIAKAREHYNSIRFKDKLDSFKDYYSFSNVANVFSDSTGIYGYMEVNEGRMVGMSRSCNNANEVKNVAAREGFGTLMYLIGMSHEPPIMPSRAAVSPTAHEFWDYFNTERGKLNIEKFKDEKALRKKTPQDCEVHGDTVLDQSYEMKRQFDIGGLKHKHAVFLEQMKSFLAKNEADFVKTRVEEYLMDAGWSFYEGTA